MARNTQVAADTTRRPSRRSWRSFVATHPSRGWSDAVDHEAHRTFINWLGCAIGAAHHEAADAALAAVQMLQPAPQATRARAARERVDMASAALVNGITLAHLRLRRHAPEDHHPPGRPGGVGACSRWPSTAARRAATLIDALVLGIDVACRVGNTMYPDHYDRGWHITGSTGMLGAAAGCARLLKLDATKTAMALGIAASQPVGMREQFGTMTKPFHPGRRGARRADVGAAGAARLHRQPARAGSAARLHADGRPTSAHGTR